MRSAGIIYIPPGPVVGPIGRAIRNATPLGAALLVPNVLQIRTGAGPELRTVLVELIDDAVTYGGGSPDVRTVTRETEINQMTHTQGLGLWFVRWAICAYDGAFELDAGDGGTAVTLELPSG
ncbi:hypothetical protein [Natronomonas sp.]|uniref:hypothetical protein n=1 Tax=Natronomonas sp. TaxID=2184060 RepID=UPI00262C7C74|nr:hypothetical protein [Natronomonas sp.]